MKINHNFFSNLAFNLAERNLGKTSTNPSVGCVIVKNNSVISSAVTSINGRPHAEYNALNKKELNFRGAYMYVTLEPCAHYGVTPPCTNIIQKKKIDKVFYNLEDPDKRTNKKAEKILKRVIKLNLKNIKRKDLYKSYFINKKKNIPYIDAKIAFSKDFFTIDKRNKWITNPRSRRVAHLIRSSYDCIVSTSKSINKDNSLLNCRIEGLDNNRPDLIIIDRNLKIKKKLKLFNLPRKRKIYLYTCSNHKKKIEFLKKKGVKIIRFDKLISKQDFKKLFIKIYQSGKGRILIESGLIFLNQLLTFKFINNLYVFKSNNLLKNNGFNNINVNLQKKLKTKVKIKVDLSNDMLFKVKFK